MNFRYNVFRKRKLKYEKKLNKYDYFLATLVYFQYTTSCEFAFKVNYDLKIPEPESHHVYFSGFQDVPVFTEYKYKDALNEKTYCQTKIKKIVTKNFSKDILNENNYNITDEFIIKEIEW